MAIEKLSVILELVSGNYKKEAKEAADATGKIGNSAKSVTGSLGAMIGPAAIAGAVVGLGKMALAAGENADRLFDLAAQTGLSTDALQQWEFVAKAAGATTEVFSDAVKAVIKNLDGTAGATGAAAKAYTALGISVKDANGNLREGGEITAEVFDRLAAMTNITERNALAQDIFGKKWEETISILDLGSEALGNLREEGKGAIVSAEALRNSDKFRETWQKFTATLAPKLNEALGKLAPALTDIVEEAAELIPMLESIAITIADIIGVAADLIEVTAGAGSELEQFGLHLEPVPEMADEFALALLQDKTGLDAVAIAALLAGAAISDSMTAVREAPTLLTAVTAATGPFIEMLDRQTTSHRNVAAAADTQRRALINLSDYQRSQLSPISNIIRLQQELTTAQEALSDAQADGKTPASELALAELAVVDAMLAVQSAGLALTPDQIQAYAQVLITQFGQSEEQALRTLEALNLLDGWHGVATFTLKMNEIASGGKGGGNINTGIVGFDSGGVVPGPLGSQQLILAHGGETVFPTHKGPMVKNGPTYNIHTAPMKDFRQDFQYLTLLASVTNLVEQGF